MGTDMVVVIVSVDCVRAKNMSAVQTAGSSKKSMYIGVVEDKD